LPSPKFATIAAQSCARASFGGSELRQQRSLPTPMFLGDACSHELEYTFDADAMQVEVRIC